ncbi:MAG: alcohol dehydrogenase catalytic domain-containing protein [Firmicutes bacterium]|nr:alcohol dehydrogenase catalytic domain-containing protein [Bacillota bacterium]
MRSAVLTKPNQIEILETEMPVYGPDEVLLRMIKTGICGSDMQMYHGKHQHLKMPQVIGHECIAEIAEVGDLAGENALFPLHVGQRVTVYPQIGCGVCPACRAGRPNLCRNQKFAGLHRPGYFQEYAVMPARNIHALPDTLNDDLAMLVEPVAVASHVLRVGDISSASRVVVIGAGTIGHLVAELSHAVGADVLAVESLESRAAAAVRAGASAVYTGPMDGLSEAILGHFGENGADVIVISRAVAKDLNTILQAATFGAAIIIVGNYKEPATADWTQIERKELIVKGSLQYTREDFYTAVRFLESGNVDASILITHRVPFEQLPETFRFIDENYKEVLKVAVEF